MDEPTAPRSGPTDGTPAAYDALHERARQLEHLRDVGGLLSWDQQVQMPPGGAPARARQRGALSAVTHDRLTDDAVGEWLAALDGATLDGLDDDRAAVVRELRREYEREASVPAELVERHSEAAAAAQETWEAAKADSAFEQFAPALEELRELRVERAQHIAPDGDPYEAMYDDGMPTLPLSTVEGILEELVDALPDLLEEIRAADVAMPTPYADRTVPAAEQEALCEAAIEVLGDEPEHSRLDRSAHPFTVGTQFDTRYTTRYDESSPLDGLMAAIHEYGHATYVLGLDRAEYGTPLGTARGEVHESQSRFWENHVGRSRAFWETFRPVVDDHLSGPTPDAETLYRRVNAVDPTNVIRVEADELTYHLHVALRATVEREYVEGELATGEIPQRWDDLTERYLGVRPETDAEGCLQDVHWTHRFGGFQTYTVGSVLAAQLTAAMREDLDLEGCIRDRAFERPREWMERHVHRHGQRYETPELVERATGEALSAGPFLSHLEGKLRPLYGL